MPSKSDIEKRNRAMICFCAMTGCRVDALRTLRLKHVDLVKKRVLQEGKEVCTKFGKTFYSYFVMFDPLELVIMEDYLDHLKSKLLFAPTDALFPGSERVHIAGRGFQYNTLSRKPWKTTQPIRNVFKHAFESNGIPYYHPHSLRDMILNYAVQNGADIEQLLALSKSFGQNSPTTLTNSYGSQSQTEIADAIAKIGK